MAFAFFALSLLSIRIVGSDMLSDVLMYRVEQELERWIHTPTYFSDGLQETLVDLYNHMTSMKLSLDDEQSKQVAFELLEFSSQAMHYFSPSSEGMPRTRDLLLGMFYAAGTMSPLCRLSHVCMMTKAPAAMWNFARASIDNLAEDGIGQWLFDEVKPFLTHEFQMNSPWQLCPQLEQSLEARAVWQVEMLPKDSVARRLFLSLKEHAAIVAEELRSGILSPEGQALIKDPAFSGLHRKGEWQAFSVFRGEGFDGREMFQAQLDPLHCRIVPRTCQILKDAGAPPGMVQGLPKLQYGQEIVDFLRATPGTFVLPHAAKTNARLSVQLCLMGCNADDSKTGSYIQVGQHRIYWRYGMPVVFDDSFVHSVKIDSNQEEPRWVLNVQVMHPSIDTVERYVTHFVGQAARSGDLRERAQPEEGGPPPLPWAGKPYPEQPLSFHNRVGQPVMLYHALWGPDQDGPDLLIGEVADEGERPLDIGQGLRLPPLAHRSRLSARNITDGKVLAAWRIDVATGGRRQFVLPVEPEEMSLRETLRQERMNSLEEHGYMWQVKQTALIGSSAHSPLPKSVLSRAVHHVHADV